MLLSVFIFEYFIYIPFYFPFISKTLSLASWTSLYDVLCHALWAMYYVWCVMFDVFPREARLCVIFW